MKLKKIYLLSTIIIFILIIFSACSNGEYDKFKTDFTKSYKSVISKLDSRDTLETLKRMKSSENKNEVESMKNLIDKIKSKVPNNKRNEFRSFNRKYEDLQLLSEIQNDWDKMTFEEQEKVFSAIGFIGYEQKQLLKSNEKLRKLE